MHKQWWKWGKHFGGLLSEAVQSQFLRTWHLHSPALCASCWSWYVPWAALVLVASLQCFIGRHLQICCSSLGTASSLCAGLCSEIHRTQWCSLCIHSQDVFYRHFFNIVQNASAAHYNWVSWVSCFPAQEFHTGLLSCWKCWHPLQLGEWSRFSHRMLFVTFWLVEAA